MPTLSDMVRHARISWSHSTGWDEPREDRMWDWNSVACDSCVIGTACAMNVDCLSVIGDEETIGEGSFGVEVVGKNELSVARFAGGTPVADESADRLDMRFGWRSDHREK